MEKSLKKLLRIVLMLITIFLIFNINNSIFAETTKLKELEYSQKYLEWLELPKEERDKTISPQMYNFRKDSSDVVLTYKNILRSGIIPSSYDLRDHITLVVKNQEDTGLCWGFAGNNALEATIQKQTSQIFNFSERHMEYASTNISGEEIDKQNRPLNSGGTDKTALAYWTSGKGPILEADMPFENNWGPINIEDMPDSEPVKKIENFEIFPYIDKVKVQGNVIYQDDKYHEYSEQEVIDMRNKIKTHIMTNGALMASMYVDDGWLAENYYNEETASYFYSGINWPNHAITIVGWDDNYSKDNFVSTNKPTTDGAYLVLNSWGETWGDTGYCWTSYEDGTIEENLCGIIGTSDIDYDNMYQHATQELNDGSSNIYCANIFSKGLATEQLNEISVNAIGNPEIEVYINSTNGNLTQATKVDVDKTTLINGYNTINLETPILLTGNAFAVVIKNLSGENTGIAIERNYSNIGNDVYANPNESYFSDDMTTWQDLYDAEDPKNIAIKAFTTSYQTTTIESIAVTTPPTKTNYATGENFNSAGMVVTATYNNSSTAVLSNSDYTITNGTNLTEGQTIITIRLNSNNAITTTQNITVITKVATSIAVTTPPTKVSYVVGENFNSAGMVVTVTYNDSTTSAITAYTVVNGTNLTLGQTSVTIRLNSNNSITTTQNITVLEEIEALEVAIYIKEEGSTNYILGISTNTICQDFLENIVSPTAIKIYDDEEEVSEGIIKTGMELVATLGGQEVRYKLQVRGDINGDGKADARDSLAILYHRAYLNDANNTQYTLRNVYFRAADLDGNNIINGQDALRILYHRAQISGYAL